MKSSLQTTNIIPDTPGMSEIQIQSKFWLLTWQHLPETRDCIFHVANEANRTVIEWGQLKGSGFRKGVQDIFCMIRGRTYLIEFKTPTGTITAHQKSVHCAHACAGFPTYIFRDSTTAFQFVQVITSADTPNLEQFRPYISPYSIPDRDLYKTLSREARQSDCNHQGNPCKKCLYVKGSPITLFPL